MGTKLLRGRTLTEFEVERGAPVAFVNQSAARLWPAGQDALGSHILIDLLDHPGDADVLVATGSSPEFTVVGVTADTKNNDLTEPTDPAIYVPYTLVGPPYRRLALRTSGDPAAMLNTVQKQVQAIDSELPVANSTTLIEMLGSWLAPPRFNVAMFSFFAALGLALATAGVYSVVSYYVTVRTQEIGVRVALGAHATDVLRLVFGMTTRLILVGIVTGLIASYIALRLARTEIFSTSTLDVRSGLTLVAVLVSAAAIASYLPARRAMHLDPMTALRHE
jgi:putative ABC transport system permease protein